MVSTLSVYGERRVFEAILTNSRTINKAHLKAIHLNKAIHLRDINKAHLRGTTSNNNNQCTFSKNHKNREEDVVQRSVDVVQP